LRIDLTVNTNPTLISNNISSKRKALIIAIGEYNGKLKSIDYCINDGKEMIDILTKLGYDNQTLIGKVTSSTLRKTIFSFFQDKNITAEDTIIFYFSGHGVPDETGKVFLASSETDPEIPSMDGFSFDDLTFLFDKKCPSLRKVMILDCCYSGSAEIGGKGIGSSEKDSEINEVNKGKSILDEKSNVIEQGEGKYLLAASQGYQEAFDLKESGHSIFTYFLLEGLKGHKEAVNDDGYVTPETIGKFIHRKIISLPTTRRPKQIPLRKGEASGEIVLAEYPNLKKEQKNDSLLVSEGIQYFENGDNDSALKLFNKAIEINPKNSVAYNYKGDIFFRLQKYEESIKWYDEALNINPYYIDVLKDKSLSLEKLGKYDMALECFNTILDKNPNNIQYWNYKGSILLKTRKYNEAIKCYNKVIDIESNNVEAWLNKAFVLELEKQNEESLICYQKVVSLEPHNIYAKDRINVLLTKHQDPNKLKEFNTLMKEGSELAWKNLFKEALEKFENAIMINPTNSYAFSKKSSVLIQMGDYKNALGHANEAIKIDANNVEALFNKGYILAAAGHYEQAIEWYNKTTDLDFKNAHAWYNKGDCYRRIGRKKEAKECFKIADNLKIE
jgi:tetratricopeptide (TPR) repeat protein